MHRLPSAALALLLVMGLPEPSAAQSGGKRRINDRHFGFDVMPAWARKR